MRKIKKIKDKEIIEEAFNAQKSMIFKNSMICPISLNAKRKFEKYAELSDEKIQLYMVDVIADRDLSYEIANRTGVVHESPQVILLENGKTKMSMSHWEIKLESLKEVL